MYKDSQILINTKYTNTICICSSFMMGFVCNGQNDGWLNFFIVFPWHTIQSRRGNIPFIFFMGEVLPKLTGYISSILWAYGKLFIDSMERSCYSAFVKNHGSLGQSWDVQSSST